MDVNIKIEIKTPMELVHAILALAETMALVVDKQKGSELIDKHITREEEIGTPVEAEEKTEKETTSPQEEEVPSLEDVRAAFMAKNSKSNTSKLKAILNKFGVKKVTELAEKDYSAVLKALEAI